MITAEVIKTMKTWINVCNVGYIEKKEVSENVVTYYEDSLNT